MGVKGKLAGREEDVIEMYLAGVTTAGVADHFGVSGDAVLYLLKRRGIARRSLSEANSLKWNEESRSNQSRRLSGNQINIGRRYKLTRIKSVPAIAGENNPAWKGGVTPIHRAIRTSPEYRQWREAVFQRDDWTCVWCGDRSAKGHKVVIHADHIKPFALFPDVRFDVSNGRTLCKACHKQTDTYGVNIVRKKTP